MPAYQNTVRNELAVLIGNTWPEVEANGIYRGQELARIDFDAKAAAGKLPLCVLDFQGVPSGEWGVSNRVDMLTARIHYVVDDSTTPDGLITKLEAMRTALWPDGTSEALTTAQVMEYPQIDDSLESTVNRYFLLRGWPYYSGLVTAQVLAGITA